MKIPDIFPFICLNYSKPSKFFILKSYFIFMLYFFTAGVRKLISWYLFLM